MTDRGTVVVVGATGRQGGAVVRKLLETGVRVRALTRTPGSEAARRLRGPGVEVQPGDLEDRDSMVAAMRGAEAVFAMTTPFEGGPDVEVRQGRTLVRAAVEAGVSHLVYSSVASADRDTGIPHFESKRLVEREVWSSAVPATVIGPTTFFENILAPWQLPALQRGMVTAGFRPDRRVQHVAVADIASFAVHVLGHPDRFAGRRIDIASDVMSGVEQAEVLSRVTGREIRYGQQSTDQIRAFAGEDMVRMVEWMNQTGYEVDLDRLHADHPEIGWHSFERWAVAQDWSVLDMPVSTAWS